MSSFIDIIEQAREKIATARDRLEKIVEAIGTGTGAAVHQLINDTDGPLSGENRTLAQSVFGNALDYDAITINDSSFMAEVNQYWNNSSRPFVLGNTINSQGPLTQKELIHELTHVWQYQTGGLDYITNSISDNTYTYNADSLAGNHSLADYNVEQQAEIVSHYFELSHEPRPLSGDIQLHNMLDANGNQITINESNIDRYIHDMQPYIEELRNTPPLTGLALELNEAPVEIIREGGEGIEEVVGEIAEGYDEVQEEIRNGNITGAIYESGEAIIESGYEGLEAGVETTYEVAEGTVEIGLEAGKDALGWLGDRITGK